MSLIKWIWVFLIVFINSSTACVLPFFVFRYQQQNTTKIQHTCRIFQYKKYYSISENIFWVKVQNLLTQKIPLMNLISIFHSNILNQTWWLYSNETRTACREWWNAKKIFRSRSLDSVVQFLHYCLDIGSMSTYSKHIMNFLYLAYRLHEMLKVPMEFCWRGEKLIKSWINKKFWHWTRKARAKLSIIETYFNNNDYVWWN